MFTIETGFEYFAYMLFGPAVILLGILGNSFGLVILRRKELDVLGPKNMYKFLFTIDSVCLLIVLNNYFIHAFGRGFSTYSWLACKLYMQFAYTFSPISPMILLYILFERYLSIKFPVESNFLRKKKTQLVYIIIILVLNFFYFLYVPFISNIRYENPVNESYKNVTLCKIVSSKKISSYFVFFARIFVPFLLIIIFSIMLVFKIVNSRNNISTFYSEKEKIIYKKDVGLSILAIVSNFIMIFLNLPLFIVFFILKTDKNIWFVFTLHLYHLCYVFQFYFFLIANSVFRKSFVSIFSRPKPIRENRNRNNKYLPESINMMEF